MAPLIRYKLLCCISLNSVQKNSYDSCVVYYVVYFIYYEIFHILWNNFIYYEKLLWLLWCLLRSIFHILCSLRMLYILRSIFYVWYDDILQVIYYVSPSYVIYLYITYHMIYNCILWICHTIYNYISYCEYATSYQLYIVNMPHNNCILWICHTIYNDICHFSSGATTGCALAYSICDILHIYILHIVYYISYDI